MIDEIKAALYHKLFVSGYAANRYPIGGIDAAAQTIAELVERQPVNRVRAMAALTKDCSGDRYIAYEVAGLAEVGYDEGIFWCNCCYVDDCEHVLAVRLYLTNKSE